MKDFKKMPKMACGGGVGKYSEGKSVEFDRTKDEIKPASMPSRLGAPKPSSSPVYMPGNLGGAKRTVNLPGFGEVDRDKVQARKTGGKVTKKKK
jgi:hypothetical protein